MSRIARGFPPTRRLACPISMGHYQRDLVLKELRAGAPLGVRSGPLNGDEKSPCTVQEMRLAEAIAARARARLIAHPEA